MPNRLRSCWKPTALLLLIAVLQLFSPGSVNNDRPVGAAELARKFYRTARLQWVKGTYHLTFREEAPLYEELRARLFGFIWESLRAGRTSWLNTRSYLNYQRTHLELKNNVDPLLPFLIASTPEQRQVLRAYEAFAIGNELPIKTGYVENDRIPEKGILDFSVSGGVALDYNNRSIGVDMGRIVVVSAARLESSHGPYRIRPDDLSIWISNDNLIFRPYQVPIRIILQPRSIFMDGLEVKTRYLKINCRSLDGNYTFAENFNRIIQLYGSPAFEDDLAF